MDNLAQVQSRPHITPHLIREKILEGLELAGYEPKTQRQKEVYAQKVDKAAIQIGNRFFSSKAQNADVWFNTLMSLPRKMSENLVWLGPLGVSPNAWGEVVLSHPNLFLLNPETNRKKFFDKHAFVAPYGLTQEDLARAGLGHGRFFAQSAEEFKAHFWSLAAVVRPYGYTPEHVVKSMKTCISPLMVSTNRIKRNHEANVHFFHSYGVSPERFTRAALKHGQLFYLRPTTLQDNFTGSLEQVKRYGVCPELWADRYIRRPRQLTSSPESQTQVFEMTLALALSPYYKVKDYNRVDPYFTRHVDIVTRMPPMSVKQVLLRLAFAEIAQPAPSGALLRETGDVVCKKLVDFLTDGRPQKMGLVNTDTTEQKLLQASLDDYTGEVVRELRKCTSIDSPRLFFRPLLSVLYPEGEGKPPESVKQKRLVLRRLKSVGLAT